MGFGMCACIAVTAVTRGEKKNLVMPPWIEGQLTQTETKQPL